MAQYSEAQKEEARKIKQRCLEILYEKTEALSKQNLDKLTALELESDRISERMTWILENPNEYVNGKYSMLVFEKQSDFYINGKYFHSLEGKLTEDEFEAHCKEAAESFDFNYSEE